MKCMVQEIDVETHAALVVTSLSPSGGDDWKLPQESDYSSQSWHHC